MPRRPGRGCAWPGATYAPAIQTSCLQPGQAKVKRKSLTNDTYPPAPCRAQAGQTPRSLISKVATCSARPVSGQGTVRGAESTRGTTDNCAPLASGSHLNRPWNNTFTEPHRHAARTRSLGLVAYGRD